ncbi:hypothetical protein TRVL_01126 [Trypanosoma vivax]|nr:hypothetical protein TRVL_01126 [Trypanosoma vivax]
MTPASLCWQRPVINTSVQTVSQPHIFVLKILALAVTSFPSSRAVPLPRLASKDRTLPTRHTLSPIDAGTLFVCQTLSTCRIMRYLNHGEQHIKLTMVPCRGEGLCPLHESVVVKQCHIGSFVP